MDKRGNHTKLVYVGFAFEHHKGTHAGYYHIKDYAQYDSFIDCQKYYEKTAHASKFFFERCKRAIMRFFFGYPYFPYFLFRMIWMSFTNKCVFHIIHGENIYSTRMQWIFKKSKVVCTFHQPFSWFDNKKWKNNLKKVDGIILLSDKEIDLFKNQTGKDNVVYIPHGVFTDFYHPNEKIKKQELILTVGNWLRDYKLADNVYGDFLLRHPDWQIRVVADKSNTRNIRKDNRIICLSGISDEELKMLYLKCSILFLPLIRYTANNALLESASCGCNILISSDNADNSYIPSHFVSIVKMEESCILDKMEEMIKTQTNYRLVNYIERHYSWKSIGLKVHNYLLNLGRNDC